MNRLDPQLKRLMTLARQAPGEPPASVPAGFATRVTARWRVPESFNFLPIWQKAIWGSGWAAAAVIVCGLAMLTAQKLRANSTYDVSPAIQLVSTELVP
jgi:hypothetical protein